MLPTRSFSNYGTLGNYGICGSQNQNRVCPQDLTGILCLGLGFEALGLWASGIEAEVWDEHSAAKGV